MPCTHTNWLDILQAGRFSQEVLQVQLCWIRIFVLSGRAASGGALAPKPPRATRSQPESRPCPDPVWWTSFGISRGGCKSKQTHMSLSHELGQNQRDTPYRFRKFCHCFLNHSPESTPRFRHWFYRFGLLLEFSLRVKSLGSCRLLDSARGGGGASEGWVPRVAFTISSIM